MSTDHAPPPHADPPFALALPPPPWPTSPWVGSAPAGPPIRLEFRYSAAELTELRAPRYPSAGLVTLRPDPLRRRLIGDGVVAGIALIYFVIGVWKNSLPDGLAAAGIIVAIYAFALAVGWFGSGRKNRFKPMPLPGVQYVVEVAPAGLVVTVGGVADVWSWWSLDGWGDTSTLLVVRRNDGARLAIPIRALDGDAFHRLTTWMSASQPVYAAGGPTLAFPVVPAGPKA